MDCSPTKLLCPWNSPGDKTGVGCHSLLQGIFLIQGLNSGILYCGQILYPLSHQRSPKLFLLLSHQIHLIEQHFFFLLLLSKDGLRLHLSLGLIDFLHKEAYGEGTCITQSLFL